MFRGIVIERVGKNSVARLADLNEEDLPEGDVVVAISHSTLNYKDALAITGRGQVVRRFPMVPGIDFAGRVEASHHPDVAVGDRVLLNGWGLGETRWGGLAEKARVCGDWLIPLPPGFDAEHAMALGTAGYTAALAVRRLQHLGITPARGDVLVTGANGGVGGVAIVLLHALGFRVVAATGRPEQGDYLRLLGADEVIDRAELSMPGKPLQAERWAGAIDSVGSHTLANVCAAMKHDGLVAACGLAQGMEFPATVAPFILRGVTLAGINSVYRPRMDRLDAWSLLAEHVDAERLAAMTHTIPLGAAIEAASDLLDGKVRGRLVVAMD
ncbi:acrylyl-CoA reductase (NADPH) [Terrihabitans sp. B22-R8]|uniref:acrylyl-CoA reductase (NADPH) n=1 Tax=Terrihabitans sp. B22-R8 TaxID=3425128 RepID=UPI00403CF343